MKRLLNATLALLAFPAMLHAQPKPGRVYFQEIREKAAKVERNSAEDLALGRQLIEEMRALGATRKKPAACSKVLSPRRGTFFSPLRERKAPLASR